MELNHKRLHRGRGVIKYGDSVVGAADEVVFVFHQTGIEHAREKDDRGSTYGTVSGQIKELELIDRLNDPEGPTLVLEIDVGDGGESTHLAVTDVRFIDEVPYSGELEGVEFHGVSSA